MLTRFVLLAAGLAAVSLCDASAQSSDGTAAPSHGTTERSPRKDYETVVIHRDGSRTTITDRGDVHIVSAPGGTNQTVGRGISHKDVVRSHYSVMQGDYILYVDQLVSGGRTRVYDHALAMQREAAVRAAGNAQGIAIQQRTAEEDAQRQRDLAARAASNQREHESYSHEGDREPHRESHAHVEFGEGSFSAKPAEPHN